MAIEVSTVTFVIENMLYLIMVTKEVLRVFRAKVLSCPFFSYIKHSSASAAYTFEKVIKWHMNWYVLVIDTFKQMSM